MRAVRAGVRYPDMVRAMPSLRTRQQKITTMEKKCKNCIYLACWQSSKTTYRCMKVRGKYNPKEGEFIEDEMKVSYNKKACEFFKS